MINCYFKKKAAFTIIELLIVIMIIGILVGVAVPYYNDYIIDSRLSVLKQNLATMRNAINQFRGDRGRGPFRVEVQSGGSKIHSPWSSDKTEGSELVAGAFLSDKSRQSNISYLSSLPTLPNPEDGSNMISSITPTGSATVCFVDDGDGIFDIDTEFAFFDEDRDETYDSASDIPLYNSGAAPADGTAAEALDYIEFEVSANGVTY
ncbi:MAG: type IV pilin protein [Candidatus Rifleibacteriota bacterium]